MSKLIAALILIFPYLARAHPPIIIDAEKKLYYAFEPVLRVSLNENASGSPILAMASGYDTEKMRKEFESLRLGYPGFRASGSVVRATDAFEISVEGLDLVQRASPKQTAYGPNIAWSIALSPRQLRSLKHAVASRLPSDIFRVRAPVEVTYTKLVATKETNLTDGTCEKPPNSIEPPPTLFQALSVNFESLPTPKFSWRKQIACLRMFSNFTSAKVKQKIDEQLKPKPKSPSSVVSLCYRRVEVRESFIQSYEVRFGRGDDG